MLKPSGKTFFLAGCALAALATLGGAASAQTAQSNSSANAKDVAGQGAAVDEVVVTGSLIRGVAPVGTNVSSLNNADIQRTGAITTNQILTNIPAISNAFNVISNTPASFARSSFRPRIRGLPDNNGNTTLVVVDGHPMVGVGTAFTTPDAGQIPPGAIERVEVVPDGGSSLYGSDAVAGIINFITKTRAEGIQVDATTGYSKPGYHTYSVNVTGGFNWQNGSALISAYSRETGELFNRDRDRPRTDLRPFGGTDFRGFTCAPGSFVASGVRYNMATRVASTGAMEDTKCDNNAAFGVITPSEWQNAVFASVTQHISEDLDFEVKALASTRLTKSRAGPRTSSAGLTINRNNVFYAPIGTEATQSLFYSYGPVLGTSTFSTNDSSLYTITPTLTYRMGEWRIRGLVDYGHSIAEIHQPGINGVLESFYTNGAGAGAAATAINPYNLAATNPQTLAQIAAYETFSRGVQELITFRANADGPVFSLPGGEVRAAFGVQHQISNIDKVFVAGPTDFRGNAVVVDVTRKVDSIYGELLIPVIGDANSLPFVTSLNLDLSARYDRYNDVGGTTNPKFGATWEIAPGWQLRGNWGTSFVAPSLSDTTGAVDGRISTQATNTLRPGDDVSNRTRPSVLLEGGNPDLKPQTADTYSVGFDISPEQVSGLTLSGTYWNIDLKNIIQAGSFQTQEQQFADPTQARFYTIRPTLAQLQSYGNLPLVGITSLAALYNTPGLEPYLLIDRRRQNVSRIKMDGVDFQAAYRMSTDWGAVYGRVSGTKFLNRKNQGSPTAPVVDELASDRIKFQWQGMLGADVGKLTATATLNRTDGFKVTGVTGQTKLKGMTTVNAFLLYAVSDDLSVSLNVDNIFKEVQPFVNSGSGVSAPAGLPNFGTLGRVFNLSVRKHFF